MAAVICQYSAEFGLTKEQLEAMLRPLTDVERLVISYRFGLIDGTSCTLQNTGEFIGLTREQVRRVEARALRKSRHAPY